MPACANRKKAKAAKARANKRNQKACTSLKSHVCSTANLKQKPIPVQPEEEESSAQEEKNNDEEDSENSSSSEEQDKERDELDDTDNDEASENNNDNLQRCQLPFRIRIIPLKRKKALQKAGPGMSFSRSTRTLNLSNQ